MRCIPTVVALLVAKLSSASLLLNEYGHPEGGLPQCTNNEPGCSEASNYESFTDPFKGLDHPHRYQTTVKLFKVSAICKRSSSEAVADLVDKGHTEREGCQENFGDKVTLDKWQCHTFDHAPRADTTLNYVLPDSKIMNHCNIVGYDGKKCRGKEVFRELAMVTYLVRIRLTICGL